MSRTSPCDLAWAAGVFDGEGTTYFFEGTGQLSLNVSQNHPDLLYRFASVVGAGRVYGPYRKSDYMWRTSAGREVRRVIRALWPWLSEVKRAQALDALNRYRKRKH